MSRVWKQWNGTAWADWAAGTTPNINTLQKAHFWNQFISWSDYIENNGLYPSAQTYCPYSITEGHNIQELNFYNSVNQLKRADYAIENNYLDTAADVVDGDTADYGFSVTPPVDIIEGQNLQGTAFLQWVLDKRTLLDSARYVKADLRHMTNVQSFTKEHWTNSGGQQYSVSEYPNTDGYLRGDTATNSSDGNFFIWYMKGTHVMYITVPVGKTLGTTDGVLVLEPWTNGYEPWPDPKPFYNPEFGYQVLKNISSLIHESPITLGSDYGFSGTPYYPAVGTAYDMRSQFQCFLDLGDTLPSVYEPDGGWPW